MLGIGVWGLAQRGLAQIPVVGVTPPAAAAGPAWRRWLAQRCEDESLNRPADSAAVRDIIGYMLAEACELYPDAPRDISALAAFLPPDVEIPEDGGREHIGKVAEALRAEPSDDEIVRALLMASVNMMPTAGAENDEDAILEALLRASVN